MSIVYWADAENTRNKSGRNKASFFIPKTNQIKIKWAEISFKADMENANSRRSACVIMQRWDMRQQGNCVPSRNVFEKRSQVA
jgi:hypothetical protein